MVLLCDSSLKELKKFIFFFILPFAKDPLVLKSPVLSHFKIDEGYVAKIKSKGYKDAMPNKIHDLYSKNKIK